MRLIRRAVRWLLRNRRSELNIQNHLDRFTDNIGDIAGNLADFLGAGAEKEWKAQYQKLEKLGVPGDLAAVVSGSSHLYSALGIIEVHESVGVPLKTVANLYFTLGEQLELNWFGNAIAALVPSSHWQALARESFREDLHWQQRALTTGVLKMAENPGALETCVGLWMSQHEVMIARWRSMLEELKATREPEYAMFSVALRELLDLAQSTLHTPLSQEDTASG